MSALATVRQLLEAPWTLADTDVDGPRHAARGVFLGLVGSLAFGLVVGGTASGAAAAFAACAAPVCVLLTALCAAPFLAWLDGLGPVPRSWRTRSHLTALWLGRTGVWLLALAPVVWAGMAWSQHFVGFDVLAVCAITATLASVVGSWGLGLVATEGGWLRRVVGSAYVAVAGWCVAVLVWTPLDGLVATYRY